MAEIPLPKCEIELTERTVTRGRIVNDHGNRVQWRVSKNDAVVATPEARSSEKYSHPDTAAGTYEIVLESWKHDGFKGNKGAGSYVEISNKVSYKI